MAAVSSLSSFSSNPIFGILIFACSTLACPVVPNGNIRHATRYGTAQCVILKLLVLPVR